MQTRSVGPVALVLVLLSPLAAQEATSYSSSETHVARVPHLAGGGAESASPSYVASGQLAAVALAGAGDSANFAADAAFLALPAALAPGAPVVLGTVPAHGSAGGGESVRVFGVHLEEGGAGQPQVAFAGAPASVVADTPTWVDVMAPAGTNAAGNPLGTVEVSVDTLAGFGRDASAYRYTPGLAWSSWPRIGETAAVEFQGEPGTFLMLFWGSTTPGLWVPLFPFDGALELVPFFKTLWSGGFVGSDGRLTFAFPVPDEGGLTNYPLELQGLAASSLAPLSGSWTNTVFATIAK